MENIIANRDWIKFVKIVFDGKSVNQKWGLLVKEECLIKIDSELRLKFLNEFKNAILDSGWKFHEIIGDVIWECEIDDDWADRLELLKDSLIKCINSPLKLLPMLNKHSDIEYI